MPPLLRRGRLRLRDLHGLSRCRRVRLQTTQAAQSSLQPTKEPVEIIVSTSPHCRVSNWQHDMEQIVLIPLARGRRRFGVLIIQNLRRRQRINSCGIEAAQSSRQPAEDP